MRELVHKSVRLGLGAAFALSILQFVTASAQAADYNIGSIEIAQPWARATPKAASSGAGYMTITNHGTTADHLTCLSSDASAKCQIHSMTMEDGVMKMRPVEGGVEIKPGETVVLKPGGLHMMFLDLNHPLEQGKTVEATLQLAHAGTAKIEFSIAGIGASAPGAPAGGGSMGGTMMMQGHHGGAMQMNKH